ncbi:MAG: alpha/beta fold hydrolase [Chloroflexi bacterium]|nr:alpha/beta fold hydrolase [Chloroflexota bacterium]
MSGTPGLPISNVPNAPATPRYTLALNAQSLAIDTLRARSYGSGPIKVTKVVSSDDALQRVLFEYPSDGLKITGMMIIPRGIGPFPVVILDHGYFKPSEYKTGDGTIRAADNFARHGYLTLAPDYRCYGGSQCATNPLDVGYAIDVLNLIASLPSLPYADTKNIGIWGHSMGGAVTIRVLAVSDQIKVAALYGAVTGDDEVHYCWLNGCRTPVAPTREPRAVPRLLEFDPDFMQGLPTLVASAPDPMARLKEIFQKSSGTRYLNYVKAGVIIHHGEADDIVPIQWSVDLADALTAQGKTATLYTYPGEGHVFAGWNWQLFMARTISFFNEYLNPRETPITVERRVLRQERGLLDLGY